MKFSNLMQLAALLTIAACDSGDRGSEKDPHKYSGSHQTPKAGSDTNTNQGPNSNPVIQTATESKSTFSIDVDTASYTLARQQISNGHLPESSQIRVEEFINYFDYDYQAPSEEAEHPFSVTTDLTSAPWKEDHQILKIGLKGKLQPEGVPRPNANLVFLVDVSGSMHSEDKIGLVKKALKMLVGQLTENDRIAIVTYAGQSKIALESTPACDCPELLEAIDSLQSGGSTNGSAGIEDAYRIAQENMIEGGINRVILTTDGDFNVGVTSESELVKLIEEKSSEGVELTTLGVGSYGYNDQAMEQMADHGNGNYAFLDSLKEAEKVLVQQVTGTLLTIAKDVKIQIDFNSERVKSYRLIGYENRVLENDDFENDYKDAGEIGAGHTVTALYEIELVTEPSEEATEAKLFDLNLRYKDPGSFESKLMEAASTPEATSFEESNNDTRFAISVAAFGMKLKSSEYIEGFGYEDILEIASQAIGEDPHGYRNEFIRLVEKASSLKN